MRRGFIKKKVKLDQVERDIKEHREKFERGEVEFPPMIFYAVHTCWWTHKAEDLSRLPPQEFKLHQPGGEDKTIKSEGLPCDPRGSVLLQTDKPEDFIEEAKKYPSYYGKHGLDAFMAAHHDNCYLSRRDPRHWSFRGWDAYNEAIDNPAEGPYPRVRHG